MKLVVQRVSRATVEVDGYVESRIGAGLVLSLALSAGDTRTEALKLAARVVKLKLWPEMFDPEKLFSSNVVDNGFEILVLCQQSLCLSFPQPAPSQQGALAEAEAQAIFEVFVACLQKNYQEEMVVAAPFDTSKVRVEATQDGPGMFVIDTAAAAALASKPALPQKNGHTPASKAADFGADVPPPKRQSAKEELQESAALRTRADWTGRAAPNTPAVEGRSRYGGQQAPSWTQMSNRSGYKGKGNGKGPRSYGIASLDQAARMHGHHGDARGYDNGQLSALPDASMKVGARVKEEMGERRSAAGGALVKRLKGTPTVAPICPAQGEDEEVWEDL